MTGSLRKIYEEHHQLCRGEGFSIMEKERGELFREVVGTGKRVLDIGCRDGALTKYFFNGNHVLGVDIDKHSLQKAHKYLGIEVLPVDLNGDWHELKGAHFDVVVAGEILEHLYFPEHVLEKVKEHLNPRGVFIGSVPNAFSFKNRVRYALGKKINTPLADPTHINHFSSAELRCVLEKYFRNVGIIGLGRYKWLSKKMPGSMAFDLAFICEK